MKKALFLLAFATLFSCPNDNDDNPETIESFFITRYASAGFNITSFAADDIIWSFNFTTNILTIENNVSATYPGTIPTGMYDFTFENNEVDIDYSSLNYAADYDQSEDGTMLTLFFDLIPQAVDDEVTYEFEAL
jgi:hypothetical protein